jgi:hypothetical protein
VLFELDKLMHGATHCGLGATACNPLRDTIAKFRPAYERRLQSLYFEPAFDLDAELSIARRMTGRDDPAPTWRVRRTMRARARIQFSLDGEDLPFQAATRCCRPPRRAGRYIPHLCWHPTSRRTARAAVHVSR